MYCRAKALLHPSQSLSPASKMLSSGVRFMPEVQVRKRYTAVEEIFHEGGPVTSTPLRRAAVLAVIRNPFAGAYVKEISGFMDDLKPLGLEMARSLVMTTGPRVHARVGGLKASEIKGEDGLR